MLKNTKESYGSIHKFLHWTIGILIIFMLIFGYFLDDFKTINAFNIHKLIGLTILLLVAIRIIWVGSNGRPRIPDYVARWERVIAYTIEGLLYVCMVAMPMLGWLAVSYYGNPPMLYGHALSLPVTPNQQYADFLMGLHRNVAVIFIGLISLHVLGALKHLIIDRDQVTQRMLPKVIGEKL